jgi:hypothetical protein
VMAAGTVGQLLLRRVVSGVFGGGRRETTARSRSGARASWRSRGRGADYHRDGDDARAHPAPSSGRTTDGQTPGRAGHETVVHATALAVSSRLRCALVLLAGRTARQHISTSRTAGSKTAPTAGAGGSLDLSGAAGGRCGRRSRGHGDRRRDGDGAGPVSTDGRTCRGSYEVRAYAAPTQRPPSGRWCSFRPNQHAELRRGHGERRQSWTSVPGSVATMTWSAAVVIAVTGRRRRVPGRHADGRLPRWHRQQRFRNRDRCAGTPTPALALTASPRRRRL